MATCSLLLNTPIPRSSIRLGQLIPDPKYPTDEACRPSLLSAATKDNDNGTIPPEQIVTSTFKDFKEVIERTRNTRFGTTLASILSLTSSASKSTSATVSSPLMVSEELADASGYFREVCREERVRVWLETHLRRPFSGVYLVSGLRTLRDARLDGTHKTDGEVGVEAAAPVWLISAAAGVPLPVDGNVAEAAVSLTRGSKNELGYSAPGDYVFAVAYRKIHFDLFSTRHVDGACVQRGNRWKSTLTFRGDQDEDGVDVEVAGQLDRDELLGHYESFDLDGEVVLFEADDDNPA